MCSPLQKEPRCEPLPADHPHMARSHQWTPCSLSDLRCKIARSSSTPSQGPWFMNTFSESRHWQAQQCSHEGNPEDRATRQNVVIFSNQLHQSIGIMSFSKNKYYDELKQVDINQAPAEPSENLTFLFHSWKNWKNTPHLETAFHWLVLAWVCHFLLSNTCQVAPRALVCVL